MVDTESNGRFSTSDQSGTFSLTITGLNRTDEGNYSCQVNNSVGTVSSTAALLTVNCKNSQVIFVAVSLSSGVRIPSPKKLKLCKKKIHHTFSPSHTEY